MVGGNARSRQQQEGEQQGQFHDFLLAWAAALSAGTRLPGALQ